MLWAKRLICGVVALMLITLGLGFISNLSLWRVVFGSLFLITGLALSYIAITQNIPKYSFWITVFALVVSVSFYNTYLSNEKTSTEEDIVVKKEISSHIEQKAKPKNNILSKYPKISGEISALSANTFYIAGRYVRLFGTDAPDVDQICSNESGATYNCGEEALSWIQGWLDKNVVDCYLLKISTNDYDLATCIWGDYDIGASLVGAGWAVAKRDESEIYLPYQAKAQSEFSGLWQGTFYTPEDWRNIKKNRNDFTIKIKKTKPSKFFNIKSWF